MHELSVSNAILDTALRHAAGRRVTVVEVSAGALRQVVPESLRFYWDIVTRDTDCQGSRLDLHEIEARVRCDACGESWTLDVPVFRCGSCGSAQVEVVTGNELCVESIDVEEEAAQCTAAG